MKTIQDGATYRFNGEDYLVTLEDSELSGDVLASLQRLPINQPDDEPSLFVRTDGTVIDTDGNVVEAQS